MSEEETYIGLTEWHGSEFVVRFKKVVQDKNERIKKRENTPLNICQKENEALKEQVRVLELEVDQLVAQRQMLWG